MTEAEDGYDRSFTPDRLDLIDIGDKLTSLKPGDILYLTHSGVVLNVSGIKIGLDIPSFLARTHPTDETIFFPPSVEDSLSFEPKKQYPISAFSGRSNSEIAKTFADNLDCIAFTHFDSDHISAQLYNEISKRNRELSIYGPIGTRSLLSKHNVDVPPAFKELLPHQSSIASNSIVSENQVILEKNNQRVTITSFETPHLTPGGHNQSMLIESNNGERILFISDSALSPEILLLVDELHTEDRPLSRIIVSGGKYNPEGLYHLLSEKNAKKFRDEFEESYAHSAYLPFVLLGLTKGSVPIDMVHHGFYHKQVRNSKNFPYRIPICSTAPEAFPKNATESYDDSWGQILAEKVQRTIYNMRMSMKLFGDRKLDLSNLTPFAGNPKKDTVEQIINNMDTRLRFSRRFRRWLDIFPVPLSIVESRMQLPTAGEVVQAIHTQAES